MKFERINIRLEETHKERILDAMCLAGYKSVSEFVITTMLRESNKIILESNLVLKTIEDRHKFVEAILKTEEHNNGNNNQINNTDSL